MKSKRHVKAGKARAKAFTREYQAWVRSHRTHASLVEAGKRGYAATFRTGKLQAIQAKLSRRNSERASRYHVAVRNWLQENHIQFSECVFPFADSMHEVDFVISPNLAIEVDGFRFKERPFGNTTRNYQAELKRKLQRLHRANYHIFVMDARKLSKELERLSRYLTRFETKCNVRVAHDDDLPF